MNANTYQRRAAMVSKRPTERGDMSAVDWAISWAHSVPGWMTARELAWLAEEASGMPVGATWVEVGVWCGRSFAAVALAITRGCRVVAVDPWARSPEFMAYSLDAFEAKAKFDGVRAELLSLRPGVGLDVTEAYSEVAARFFDKQSVNAVFIDGGHSYHDTRSDIEAWLPKIKPGGLLCGHDGTMPEVAAAVGDVLGKNAKVGVESIWYHEVDK